MNRGALRGSPTAAGFVVFGGTPAESASALSTLEELELGDPGPEMILFPQKEPPPVRTAAEGTQVTCCAVPAEYAPRIEAARCGSPAGTVYAAVAGMLAAVRPPRLLVRELDGLEEPPFRPVDQPKATWILPHLGSESELAWAIAAIRHTSEADPISAGWDGRSPGSVNPSRFEAGGSVRVAGYGPRVVGPYFIREDLVRAASSPLVFFEDSDDLPTFDRAPMLRHALTQSDHDIVGSHYLRVDDLAKEVRPVRFPLDVNAALASSPGHTQLLPTTIARKQSVLRVGGFSTALHFGADTQFLLRASFSLRLANVDRFLYIKRRHENSLTTRPETGFGSPERTRLDALWKAAFHDVKLGKLDLLDSPLAASKRTEPVGDDGS